MEKIRRVSIPEGGVGRNFATGKISTRLQEGGSCLWVPESAVAARKLTARENREYLPEEDDLYGYSEVAVNVNTYLSHDNEIIWPGTLDREQLPAYIEIVHEPNRSAQGIPYADGERIDTTGLVVRARMEDGTEWPDSPLGHGLVPFGELWIEPTAADEQRCTEVNRVSGFGEVACVDPLTSDARIKIIETTKVWGGTQDKEYEKRAVTAPGPGQQAFFVVTMETGNKRVGTFLTAKGCSVTVGNYTTYSLADYDGKKAYYNFSRFEINIGVIEVGTPISNGTILAIDLVEQSFPITNYDESDPSWLSKAAWTAIYGDVVSRNMPVSVHWARPVDHKDLTTTFKVKIQDSLTNTGEEATP